MNDITGLTSSTGHTVKITDLRLAVARAIAEVAEISSETICLADKLTGLGIGQSAIGNVEFLEVVDNALKRLALAHLGMSKQLVPNEELPELTVGHMCALFCKELKRQGVTIS